MVPIDHFDVSADRRRHQVAIVDGDVTITYGELVEMSHRVAALVAGTAGGEAPVPAVVFSPNHAAVLVAMVGIMRAGGVIVPLHASTDVETGLDFLQQVQPRCIFYHSSLANAVRQLTTGVPSLQRAVCLDGPAADASSLESALREACKPAPEWIDAEGNRSRPVFYWATSGSTGRPKVVIEDCGGFDANLKVARGRRDRRLAVGTTMSLAPMTHGGGPSAFTTLVLGGTVLVARGFDASHVLQCIERYQVTELWLPPSALALLVDHPDVTTFDVSSLRLVTLGASAVSMDTLKRAVEVLGPCIVHSYGQIEASFITLFDNDTLAAAVRGDLPAQLLASSGRTLGLNRVAVMGPGGRLLPPGEAGEIVVRGACVKRYLDAAATAAARESGWHHTGDLGYLDEEGFLFVTGRLRDVVNVAGFKVPAAQVERTILELTAVQDCAVVAVPDSSRGEVAKAIVTLRHGSSVTPAEVIAHCRARIGARKAPQHVEVWPSLPMLAAGKVDKQALRRDTRSLHLGVAAVRTPVAGE